MLHTMMQQLHDDECDRGHAHWRGRAAGKLALSPSRPKSAANLDSIRITAAESSEDITGQAFASDVLKARFSRTKSGSIAWSGASSDNVAQLADEFWQHPILDR
jgi:hypothetical protein